jgi:hypothetical protein
MMHPLGRIVYQRNVYDTRCRSKSEIFILGRAKEKKTISQGRAPSSDGKTSKNKIMVEVHIKGMI